MQTLVNIPSAALTPGLMGPFSAVMPPSIGKWRGDYTKVVWPASGNVLKLTVEESKDDGQTWQFSASLSLAGGTWRDRAGGTVNSGAWDTTPMYSGTGTRIRVFIDVLQACTIGGSVSA